MASSFAAYSFGILLIYAFGASFEWNVVAFCGTVLPVVAFISFSFVPESPAWLIREGKIEKARSALLWLRGGDMEQVKIIPLTRLRPINFPINIRDNALFS